MLFLLIFLLLQAGKSYVSFLSYFLLGDLEKYTDILFPEAAFFARWPVLQALLLSLPTSPCPTSSPRTYLVISRVVGVWRVQLGKVN